MTDRWLKTVGVLCISLACATQVSAEILCDAWNSIVRDVKRRQCWPEPFNGPDRATVRAPFAIQVANGWRRQNMLGEYHFQEGSDQLTEAGRLKVRWILTVCPQQHRLIYVHIGETEEDTAKRIASVQKYAMQVTPDNVPPIMSAPISDEGWPADEVDAIGRKFQATMPDPRLPASTGSQGSGMSN